MSIAQFKKYLAMKNQVPPEKAEGFVVLMESPVSQTQFAFMDDSFRFRDFLEVEKSGEASVLRVLYDASQL